MPTTKSAKKRLKQSEARRLRNRATKTSLKTQIRKVSEAAGSDATKAETEFRLAVKKLDRAGARGVIHKNTAARQKSRLSRLLKTAKQGAKPATA
jgi:small subunit ribosomal protein S20